MKFWNKYSQSIDSIKNSEQSHEANRNKRMIKTSLVSALAKIISMAVPIITVRVSLSYLGTEIYGLWMTVTSLFSILVFADFGLGSGVQTILSRASANSKNIDHHRKIISSAFFMLLFVSLSSIFVLWLVFPLFNWEKIVNAQSSISRSLTVPIVFAIFIPKLISIPLGLIERTQLAFQEGYKAYIWQTIGSILSLISVFASSKFNIGPIYLILLSSTIPVAMLLGNMMFYFGISNQDYSPRIKFFDSKTAKELLSTGSLFFVLMILTTIGLQLDNLIVAQISSLESVSSYSILLRVSQILNIAISVISAPLWSANGEALGRGDVNWVRKSTQKLSRLMFSITLTISILTILGSPIFFRIWLGNEFVYSTWMFAGMLSMQVLYAFINPFFMVLNGAGMIRGQISLFLFYTPISLLLKLLIGNSFGIVFIPWVGVISYSIIIIPKIIHDTKKTLQKSSALSSL